VNRDGPRQWRRIYHCRDVVDRIGAHVREVLLDGAFEVVEELSR